MGAKHADARGDGVSDFREEDVRVISPFVGGAFGSSLRPWSHPVVAAMAARAVRRPVKLVVETPADVYVRTDIGLTRCSAWRSARAAMGG